MEKNVSRHDAMEKNVIRHDVMEKSVIRYDAMGKKVLLDMMPWRKSCFSFFSVLFLFPSQNCFLMPWKTLIDENQLQQTKSSELLGLVFLPSDYWIPLHGRQMLLIKPLIFPEGVGRKHEKKDYLGFRLFIKHLYIQES